LVYDKDAFFHRLSFVGVFVVFVFLLKNEVRRTCSRYSEPHMSPLCSV
jgi:hypothetical protein